MTRIERLADRMLSAFVPQATAAAAAAACVTYQYCQQCGSSLEDVLVAVLRRRLPERLLQLVRLLLTNVSAPPVSRLIGRDAGGRRHATNREAAARSGVETGHEFVVPSLPPRSPAAQGAPWAG